MGNGTQRIQELIQIVYVPIDITDCYDDDTQETRRMMHSSGLEHAPRRGGAENNDSRPMTMY